MRAAWLTGCKQLDIREIELPAPSDGQLLIDVVGCGVCGSNLHEWHSAHAGANSGPGATGHEIVGVVAGFGGTTSGFAVGDAVVIEPSAIRACQNCPACADGATWFCAHKTGAVTYGFADQMVVPAAAAYRVPVGVDLDVAVLTEPIACGVHAVRHSWTARVDGRVDGLDVVVLGAGMLGLGSIAAAKWLGAASVTAVARHRHQAEAATIAGATRVLSDSETGLSGTLRRIRPSMVIEAVGGTAGTLSLSAEAVGWRGEVVVVGAFEKPQPVNVGALTAREIRMFFPVSYAARDGVHDFQVALDLLSAHPDFRGFVTHRLPLEDINEAFALANDKTSGSLRVLVGSA